MPALVKSPPTSGAAPKAFVTSWVRHWGDRAAAKIAAAMGAERLIILSNVPGLLEDKDDETTLIPLIERDHVDEFEHFAKGRMRKKGSGAVEGWEGGVGEVIFADPRGYRPIDAALNHQGTVIR